MGTNTPEAGRGRGGGGLSRQGGKVADGSLAVMITGAIIRDLSRPDSILRKLYVTVKNNFTASQLPAKSTDSSATSVADPEAK